MRNFTKLVIATFLCLAPLSSFAQQDPNCTIDFYATDQILSQVEQKNPEAIRGLRECFKLDRKLMLKAIIIDPTQFQFAAEVLKSDESFVRRLLKVSPSALQYASPQLRSNTNFMEEATYLSRDSLQYAESKLRDNKIFMRRMIQIDSRNYKFASDRLREIPEFAEIAFEDDGLLLEYAPAKIKNDKNLVTIATNSNESAIAFASDEMKKEKEFQFAPQQISSLKKEDLEKFLRENYITKERQKNLGSSITSKAKKFPTHQIIDRNYVTKWLGDLRLTDETINKELHLIAADSRNYPILWKKDFHKHPDLIKKIENFLANHNVDQSAIDLLSTTYFWKIKNHPETLAFNLYLLRDSHDADFGPEFSDATSLTAIVSKRNKKWEMTVVEVIFDSEIKTEIGYLNGHKKYVLWDLYKVDKHDKNPKIIFKVEDRFKEYFEIFEEQTGGKYKMIYRFDYDL